MPAERAGLTLLETAVLEEVDVPPVGLFPRLGVFEIDVKNGSFVQRREFDRNDDFRAGFQRPGVLREAVRAEDFKEVLDVFARADPDVLRTRAGQRERIFVLGRFGSRSRDGEREKGRFQLGIHAGCFFGGFFVAAQFVGVLRVQLGQNFRADLKLERDALLPRASVGGGEVRVPRRRFSAQKGTKYKSEKKDQMGFHGRILGKRGKKWKVLEFTG